MADLCYCLAAAAVVVILLVMLCVCQRGLSDSSDSGAAGTSTAGTATAGTSTAGTATGTTGTTTGTTGGSTAGAKVAGTKSTMMNTYHWDQAGSYQHTADTWGLPAGEGRPNYSGYSWGYGAGAGDPGLLPGTPADAFVYPREKMSVGAHWVQDGTYGHTAGTLPAFDYSGYYEDVPTDSYA